MNIYSTFWKRLLAAIIDSIVCGPLLSLMDMSLDQPIIYIHYGAYFLTISRYFISTGQIWPDGWEKNHEH